MGARLVGDHVHGRPEADQLRHDLRRIAEQSDRQRLLPGPRRLQPPQRILEAPRPLVEISGRDPPLDPAHVDLDARCRPTAHRDRQRLGAAHAAQPRGDDQPPGERPAEPLAGHRGERLVGALEDPLRSDVDPGPRRHLPVHHQAHRIQPAKLVPRRPERAPGWSSRSGRAAPPRASRSTATGLPDCTSSVSSAARRRSSATIASRHAWLRAAFRCRRRPRGPAGAPATSGWRLLRSIRNAASCSQPRHSSDAPMCAACHVRAALTRCRSSLPSASAVVVEPPPRSFLKYSRTPVPASTRPIAVLGALRLGAGLGLGVSRGRTGPSGLHAGRPVRHRDAVRALRGHARPALGRHPRGRQAVHRAGGRGAGHHPRPGAEHPPAQGQRARDRARRAGPRRARRSGPRPRPARLRLHTGEGGRVRPRPQLGHRDRRGPADRRRLPATAALDRPVRAKRRITTTASFVGIHRASDSRAVGYNLRFVLPRSTDCGPGTRAT